MSETLAPLENTYDPEEDGVKHINVYSKGRSGVGRFLSNFAYSPFKHPEDGEFDSIEGYWYWLGTKDPKREALRTMHGFEAKKFGRSLRAEDYHEEDEEFKRKVKLAITAKLEKYPTALEMVREVKLPLVHYYVYGSKVLEPQDGKWIWEHMESLL